MLLTIMSGPALPRQLPFLTCVHVRSTNPPIPHGTEQGPAQARSRRCKSQQQNPAADAYVSNPALPLLPAPPRRWIAGISWLRPGVSGAPRMVDACAWMRVL